MDRYDHILGCLLGAALGDAVGLRREGLSRRRAMRMYGGAPLKPGLAFGLGLCSDDTEHTQMAGRAIARSAGKPAAFAGYLASDLKRWLLTAPAGVGFGTLRACLKLLLGSGPTRSGVFSAGNGPAMRAAILGVSAKSDFQLLYLVSAATRITHTDSKAEEGAVIVARAARLAASGQTLTPREFLASSAEEVPGAEFRDSLRKAVEFLDARKTATEFADSQGWNRGVSGYVNQTVPAALYCWARHSGDFRECVESAVLLGGDADTVGSIAGAICGANLGASALPREWLAQLNEWPRTVAWMHDLARSITVATETADPCEPPPMRWLCTIPRNALFAAIVLGLGFRRLLPPY